MSLAMKYAMKKRASKMGGSCPGESCPGCNMCKGGMYAAGGFVEEETESGYQPMPAPEAEDDSGEEGIVDRIMQRFSKGGQVANDTDFTADKEPAEFDELVKDDTESADYDDDGPGDEQEDDDRKDVVARIMKSRGKKDKMPRPA